MLENLMIPKEDVICVPESFTCQQAVELLEEHHLRNAPVVDESGSLYRGNIYRYHIYKYKFHHPEVDLNTYSVTYLLKNTTKTVLLGDSLFHLMFMMQDLPYVAVLNEQNSFLGIIKHEIVYRFLKQAWVIDDIASVLSIQTRGFKGDLRRYSRMINRFCDISLCMTLEETDFDTESRILFGIPKNVDQIRVKMLLQYLKHRQVKFDVFEF